MNAQSPLRLLLTVDAVGGVWQYATDLAAALQPRGVETLLVSMGPQPSARQRAMAAALPGVTLIETGLELDWLARDEGAVLEAGRRLAQIAGELRADVVQLNMPALAARTRFPAPVVTVTHSCVASWWDAVEGGPLPADFAWRKALVAEGYAAVDRVVAPSAAHARATQRIYGLATLPTVIHNGRTPTGTPRGAPQDFVLTAGRLWDRAKNITTLDAAAARLPVPVKAAGALDGPNGERVALAHAQALGPLTELRLAQCLAKRPVFASIARYEPFGLAVLEAASAGCALVLSDIPTFRELWDGAARFVSPDDASGLAAAIMDVLADPAARAEAGERALAAAARYTPGRMADAMASLYRELAAVSGPALSRAAA